MELEIDYLADHVDAIPTLARWHHDQWASSMPELTIAEREKRFRARATTGAVPTGFVAVADGRVVGMACLVECDLESHAHLSPWLATVLVAPNHRGRGIGSALCRRVTEEARLLGFARVYLFTLDKQDLYRRLGWWTVEQANWREHRVTIMANDLAG
jgi:N-acetylglutamate synthase-like GNAT family acetyltransferase